MNLIGDLDIAKSIEAEVLARIGRAAVQREEANRLEEKLDKLNDTMEKVEHNTRRTGEGTDQIEKNTRGPAPVAVQENVTQHGER